MTDIESSDEYSGPSGPSRRTRIEQCSEDAEHGNPVLQQLRRDHFKASGPSAHSLDVVVLHEEEPRPCTAKEEAQTLIEKACYRDPDSKQFTLAVIGGALPEHIKTMHSNILFAEVNGKEAERILDDAFAFLGSARLILCNPTVELLIAIIAELPSNLHDHGKERVTTYFMGHGADGRFFLRNGQIHISDEVVTKFNDFSTKVYPMQHFHYFDCCRVGEYFSFPANCLKGDAAVIYSTQPGQIAYTGEGIRQDIGRGSWSSDGVGVFTRRFAMLVKTHEGDFEQFIHELGCRTKEELERLDPELNTDYCRPILHTTNEKKINFKEEREKAMRPRDLHVELSEDGYLATLEVQQPPSLVVHHKYSVQTHRVQMSVQSREEWTNVGEEFKVSCTPGEPQTCPYQVFIPMKMFGYSAEFRILAMTGDFCTKIYSESTSLPLPSLAKPVLKEVSRQQKSHFFRKKTTISWNHIQPPSDLGLAQNDASPHCAHPPEFHGYSVEVKQPEKHEDSEQLQDNCNYGWEEIGGLRIDQKNCTASFKFKPGVYQLRVLAKFEGDESVASEIKEIVVPKSFFTCCGLFVTAMLMFLLFFALGLMLAVSLTPRQLSQTQLYQNDVIECATSNSVFNRILFSSWSLTECPNPLETPYNDINATVISLNGGKKGEAIETIPVGGTFASGRYSLPYPSVGPHYVQDRYMVEDSTVNFELCLTPEHASSSPFVIEMFTNFTYFASFVRSGEEYDVYHKFGFALSQPEQEVCQNYSYVVKEATYLYFSFSTPVDIFLNITTVLGERQYVSSSEKWEYKIHSEKSATRVPISPWRSERVLCYSNTIDYDRDRTHICATPELRVLTLIVIGLIWLACCGLTGVCYCGRKCRKWKKSTTRVRGNYTRLQNTTVQQV